MSELEKLLSENQEGLKGCPFCGSDAENYARTSHVPQFNSDFVDAMFVTDCTECNANIELETSEQEAIKAWNTRPREEKLAAISRALFDALDFTRMLLPDIERNLRTGTMESFFQEANADNAMAIIKEIEQALSRAEKIAKGE